MDKLFIRVYEITRDGINEKVNEKFNISKDIHDYNGFEFKLLYVDDEFVQLLLYAYNTHTTIPLLRNVNDCGRKIGIKLDTPVLIETDGGFAGVLCSYVFQISKHPITKSQMYQGMGINEMWKISPESYRQLAKSLYNIKRSVGFLEMMNYIDGEETICNATQRMVKNTVVYNENFVSGKSPKMFGNVSFQENLTLMAAKSYVEQGKHTAILNFANPIEPGGGVLRNANAQEENLCRLSNLYKSLISENARNYYDLNRNIIQHNQFNGIFVGTDMAIYSPDVMVLKDSVGYRPGSLYEGREEYNDSPYCVDVITCAAPFFRDSGYIIPNGDLAHLLQRRIKNIFEVVIENGVEVIILGAFGCGAFHNPPDVVANAFRSVLLERRYANSFNEVAFVVKRSEIICSNIEAFERNFSMFPAINNNGNEKKHRLLWKWTCNCGMENHWDSVYCPKCKKKRTFNKGIKMYNS